MVSIVETNIYKEVLKEFNYSFGNVFVFGGFVVAEINNDIVFSWNDHAKHIVGDVTSFFGSDGGDLIYISNRVNSYSVLALDWLKFFKYQYFLKGYYIVDDNKLSKMNLMIEQIFFRNKIKHFNSIYTAINWIKKADNIVIY